MTLAAQGLVARTRPSDRPWAGVVVRAAAVAAALLVTAAIHLPGRPSTLCVLRALTGIPCPFCGGTTAAVHLGHGDVPGAVVASPLAVLLAALLPWLGVVPQPRWWRDRWARRTAIGAVLVLSEVWQLHRFGLLAS